MNDIVLLDPKQDSDFITKYYSKYNLEIDTTTVDHVVARTFHDLLFYAMRYNNYHHEAQAAYQSQEAVKTAPQVLVQDMVKRLTKASFGLPIDLRGSSSMALFQKVCASCISVMLQIAVTTSICT